MFCVILTKNPCSYANTHCADRAEEYMNKRNLSKLHITWVNIIYACVVIYKNLSHPVRVQNQNRIKKIVKKIEGIHRENESNKKLNIEKEEEVDDKITFSAAFNI